MGWGVGRRYWFEIIILLSVGVGVLVSLIVACDLVVGGLGSVSFRLPFFGVSFGIVGWVGGRGGLDRLVGEWVTRRSRCTCCCSNFDLGGC